VGGVAHGHVEHSPSGRENPVGGVERWFAESGVPGAVFGAGVGKVAWKTLIERLEGGVPDARPPMTGTAMAW